MLLEGKKGLVMGIANERSIAWGIAHEAYQNGAKLCLTYQNELFKEIPEPHICGITSMP